MFLIFIVPSPSPIALTIRSPDRPAPVNLPSAPGRFSFRRTLPRRANGNARFRIIIAMVWADFFLRLLLSLMISDGYHKMERMLD
jgi:hypothetical protein